MKLKYQDIYNYYVPTIDEFCVGFPFIHTTKNNIKRYEEFIVEWTEYSTFPIDTNHSAYPFDKTDFSNFRVKKVDTDDLIDLGCTVENFTGELITTEGTYYIVLSDQYNSTIFIHSKHEYMFRGTIKNKFELERMLEKLGISKSINSFLEFDLGVYYNFSGEVQLIKQNV